ncbi:MAG: hypothetical protein ABRQ25_18275 [Clostridiaceae bacterium]
MENFTGYFKMVYLLPVTISLFYLLLQVLSDIKRVKMGKKTAFEDRDHIIDCAMACFIPVLNIYMAYIGIRVMVKSAIKDMEVVEITVAEIRSNPKKYYGMLRVIEIVYFTDAHLNLHKGDISYRIHKAEFHTHISERNIYRYLKKARIMFAVLFLLAKKGEVD